MCDCRFSLDLEAVSQGKRNRNLFLSPVCLLGFEQNSCQKETFIGHFLFFFFQEALSRDPTK